MITTALEVSTSDAVFFAFIIYGLDANKKSFKVERQRRIRYYQRYNCYIENISIECTYWLRFLTYKKYIKS